MVVMALLLHVLGLLALHQCCNISTPNSRNAIQFRPIPQQLVVGNHQHFLLLNHSLHHESVQMVDCAIEQLLDIAGRVLEFWVTSSGSTSASSKTFLPADELLGGTLDTDTGDLLTSGGGLGTIKEPDRFARVYVGVFGSLLECVERIESYSVQL